MYLCCVKLNDNGGSNLLKILHTADLHVGAKYNFLGEKGAVQRRELLNCLDKIVDLAVTEKVHMTLFAGDLFDSNVPSSSSLERVRNSLIRLVDAGVTVLLIPGTHDGGSESIYADFEIGRSQNPLILTSTSQTKIPGLDLTVNAFVGKGKTDQSEFAETMRASRDSRFTIGIAHGNLSRGGLIETDPVIWEESVSATDLIYLALGHWHSFECKRIGKTTVCYPGAPEFISVDQKGYGSVALVKIDEEGNVEVESRKVAATTLESVDIKSDDFSNQSELAAFLERFSGSKTILNLSLLGVRRFNIDIAELVQYLDNKFFHIKVVDLSHPAIADLESIRGHPFIEAYTNEIKKRIELAEDEQVIRTLEEAHVIGVLLLEGKKIL